MSRFRDFDLFSKELDREPIHIVVLGEEVELPSMLPAKVMVDIIHIQALHNGELPPHEIVNMAEKFFGEDNMKRWLSSPHFSMEMLAEMLRWVIAEYSGGGTGEVPHATYDTGESGEGPKHPRQKNPSPSE